MSRKGKKPNKKKQWNSNDRVKDKRQNIIYTGTFFMGIALGFSAIILYKLTIIPAYIPLLMTLITGLITSVIDWKRYGKTYDYYGEGLSKMLGCYFMNLCWWGSLVAFLFLAINFYGGTKEHKVEELSITKWSSQKGGKGRREKRLPVFTINYQGLKKAFVFGHAYYANRATYKVIALTTQQGLLGYTIIKDKELLLTKTTK